MRRPVSIENIAGLTVEERSMEELAKRPGIVGYAVKDGDDLFGLAKTLWNNGGEYLRGEWNREGKRAPAR